MSGLNKPRTPAGKFLDEHGISHSYIAEETELSMDTLTRIFTIGKKTQNPTRSTRKLILEAIKKKIPQVKMSDLWEDE
ncbi:transcriptional regulator [Brevibacillus choshinensis]|uniref:Transcriptional regulator n=1 Tax=Brevibacillus choshinensis TaxID=54911 RepID=A0ABX7FQW1_BRECH|nr:transcriptional regulator [Brevibacillus choshinensis]QRG68626.1 transcriptional regulator [Brevibacillus choshinensis]